MIIVTGASRGIGKYLYDEFRKEDELSVWGTHTQDKGELFYLDLAEPDSIKEFADIVPDYGGSLLTLLNCAGTNYNSKLEGAKWDQWEKTVQVNLIGTASLISWLLPKMKKNKFGRIINFSSVVPQLGVPGTTAYSASKSALWGLTKSLAKEVAGQGITVNCLNLGYFNAGMIKEVPEPVLGKILEQIPAKRLGELYEIKNAVDFIRRTPYLNGASIDLNGGLF